MTDENFKFLVQSIQRNYSEVDPVDAYMECCDKYGDISANDPIWKLVDDAIKFAVEQTIDYIAEHSDEMTKS